jgi:hypothetical protein
MTEDQLVNELTERGKDNKGSREQLIERLVQLDKGASLNKMQTRFLSSQQLRVVHIET